MHEKDPIIIIDNGSTECKAGFSNDEAPRSVIQSIVGHRIIKQHVYGKKISETIFDNYSSSPIFDCEVSNPFEGGVITNWDDMEEILNHVFKDELRVDPSDHTVLITEPLNNPKVNREKIIQIMFETFNVPSFYSINQSVLSIYSTGSMTGISVESGGNNTEIVPVYEGYYIPHASTLFNLAGNDLTKWLKKLLMENGYSFEENFNQMEIVRDIKEHFSYVALDYDSELKKAKSSSECNALYTLSDGKEIVTAEERFRCPELFFKPQLNGFEFNGIDKTLIDSIMKCDIDIQEYLYSNIVLSGGSTMFKGFPERFEKEILNQASSTNVKIVAQPDRKYAAWIGGSILASQDAFQQMVITRDEYNEYKAPIIHSKCL